MKTKDEINEILKTFSLKRKAYNIFEVLDLEDNEVKHSKFISDLLNPYGKHKYGSRYLEAFIKIIKIKMPFSYDIERRKMTEVQLGNISNDKVEGGRIDILLVDKYKNSLTIENKIFAEDQPLQLHRYYNETLKHFNKETNLIYLTLNGNPPNKYTLGTLPSDKVLSISYTKHILDWISKCISITPDNSDILPILKQYKNTIEKLTYDNKLKQEVYNKLISTKSTSATENPIFNEVFSDENHLPFKVYCIIKDRYIKNTNSKSWSEISKEVWKQFN